MATLFGMFPFLQKLFADGGYQGPEFSTALAKVRPHLNVEIVKRSDRAKGFVVLSKRWIVERTLAWLNRCRRLAKDWENRNRKALNDRTCPIRLQVSVEPVREDNRCGRDHRFDYCLVPTKPAKHAL